MDTHETPTTPDAFPIPPGLPSLERPERLLWWQGALAMLGMIPMLIVANVAAALVSVAVRSGTEGLAQLQGDTEALVSFPLVAAGQAANLIVFVTIAVLAPFLARVPHRTALGLGGAPVSVFALGAVGILGLSPLADRIVRELTVYFPDQSALEMIERAVKGQPLWSLVPVLAVIPAVGEELLCRGVLQRSLRSPWVALPVSAVFFAALHMDPLHMAGVLPLGFFLAWLGQRTNSVWVPIAAHFTNNLAATLSLFASESLTPEEAELPLYAIPVGLLVTLVCSVGIHFVMRWQASPTPPAPPRDASLAEGSP